MKLIEAVRSVQSKPYVAFLLSEKNDLDYIVNHIISNCSSSCYCVRSIENALLDAHITSLCLFDKGADLMSLTAWFLASKFEYLVEKYADLEIELRDSVEAADDCYRDYLTENRVTEELIRRYATYYTSGDLCRDSKTVYETIILQTGVGTNETICKGFN